MKHGYLNKWTALLLIFSSLFFWQCQEAGKDSENENNDNTEANADSTQEEGTTKAEEKPKPVDKQYEDIARFIAGIPPEKGSKLESLTSNPAWKNYAQVADGQWAKMDNGRMVKMKKWTGEYLKEPNAQKGVLFYPFSGADILHAATFFPEAEEIVMIGLEPIGSMPDFEKIAQKSLGAYFNGIQTTIYEVLNLSFFKTIDMAQEFTGRAVSDLDGTLPVLLLFLKRTHHEILYYEKVAVLPDGTLATASEENTADTTYIGTKIAFRREGKEDEYKTLYYFAANIDNNYYESRSGLRVNGLKKHVDFRKYLESLNINATYLKSASYLMYRESFSIIRNLILDKSKYVLQDDSGMPFKYFADGKWDVTLFGRYAGPIGLFSSRYQNDFAAAYKNGEYPIKPLPFGIGYQYREGTSNLILAVKK